METGNQEKSKGKIVLCAVLLVFLTATIEWFYFGFQNVDFLVPISYSGDGMGVVLNVKAHITGDNIQKGFPFFQDFSVYQAQKNLLQVIFFKLCGVFTKNAALVNNLYLFTIPFFNVFVCFWVLRHFKVRIWLAYMAALTFGFCPYVQFRLPGHCSLAAVECIPIVIMLCVWCMEDPTFEQPCKGWFRYKRNWLALFFTWMIANNGMVYYPFFSCFVLLVTALCLLLRERRLKAVASPGMLIVQIAGWLAVGFIPSVIGILKGAGNVATNGAVRVRGDAIRYMLRINSLLLSPKGYGIRKIKEEISKFLSFTASNDSFYTENRYAYMGIVPIIGFGILLFYLFYVRNGHEKEGILVKRLVFLSKITVAILILAVSTGLGTLINIVILYIRCYNRISPFLVFCGVFTVALCAETWLLRMAKRKRMALKYLLAVAVMAVFGYGLFEQQGIYLSFPEEYGESMATVYAADQRFVDEIEKTVGEDAMIFQLPYMRSFENGPVKDVPDYDHNRGLIHSDTLRWSYGGLNGGENDKWYKETSEYSPVEMVSELYFKGFSGIWLNLDGYEAEEGIALEAELCSAANCEEPIRCEDGHTVFIPFSQEQYWYLVEDHLNGVVKEIHYLAEKGVIEEILAELSGDEASVRYLEDSLRENGMSGGEKAIVVPEDGTYQLHRKTPLEKGELVSIDTVVNESELNLADIGSLQLVGVPFTIKENALYQVDLVLDSQTDFSAAENMIVDLYGGPEYDRPEQEASNFIVEGKYRYTFYFDSGDVGGETRDVQVRAYVFDLSTVINLDEFRVIEVECGAADQ